MEIVSDVIDWFLDESNRIFLWIAIGVVVIALLIVVLMIVAHFKHLDHHKEFSVDNREANNLALGFQQITNSSNYWNDPTASLLEKNKRQQKQLQELWGLSSQQDVLENVERLATVRRRREFWQQLLALRAEAAAANGGRRPSSKQWLEAIKDAGGTGKGEEKRFVDAVAFYEKQLGKGKGRLFPADAPVVSFDGYALGQAVAVATWSVGLGVIRREDAQHLIEQVNQIAREEFDSWEAFGRSYVLGRAMHWSDGTADEKRAEQAQEAAEAMMTALNDKRSGPWGLLPWRY